MIMVLEKTEGGMISSFYENVEEALEEESKGRYWTEKDTKDLKAFGNSVMGEYMNYSKGYFVRVDGEVIRSGNELAVPF
jgi:hypothetical protein